MKTLMIVLTLSLTGLCEEIGKVQSSGIIFKDEISIIAFDDPSLKGIVCYTTNYSRVMDDDSTNSSLDCRKISKIEGSLSSQKSVFSQDKTFLSLYKKTVVDRIYDEKRNVLIYLSYTKSFGNKNANHSISVVPLN